MARTSITFSLGNEKKRTPVMTNFRGFPFGPVRVIFSPGEVLMMSPDGVVMFLTLPVTSPVTGNPQLLKLAPGSVHGDRRAGRRSSGRSGGRED